MIWEPRCPRCKGSDLLVHGYYETENNGRRKEYECKTCGKTFAETRNSPMAGLRTPIGLVAHALWSRFLGLSFNACCELNGISPATLARWESRFADLKLPLFIYLLAFQFLKLEIEGDELYTKVGKNVPVEDCEGWTITLMDRASRFIFVQECGRRKRRLFMRAMRRLMKIVNRTKDVTLITDGERRYGNILFELCNEVVRTSRPGRPQTTLRQGVKVRLKNKGNRSNKPGRKRKKYEAPQPEHPRTKQGMPNSDIHADHVEADNAAIRRDSSPFRRRTNTYAKKMSALQRVLDCRWVFRNFSRKHYTTKVVPAVALGIITAGISIEALLSLPCLG
jgi:transposase-like protein